MENTDLRKTQFFKRLNHVLSVILFVLAVYIISMPFLPELELRIKQNQDQTKGFVYQSSAAEEAGVKEDVLSPIPEENIIIIPKINVDAVVLEGQDISVLEHGSTWRRPQTSQPTDGGNTVIVAHRYFGQGKNTFYHLNKLEPGDEIILFWDGKEHIYKVDEVFETNPENISVEDNTTEDLLTLYTCSGLAAEKRYVVRARPVIKS